MSLFLSSLDRLRCSSLLHTSSKGHLHSQTKVDKYTKRQFLVCPCIQIDIKDTCLHSPLSIPSPVTKFSMSKHVYKNKSCPSAISYFALEFFLMCFQVQIQKIYACDCDLFAGVQECTCVYHLPYNYHLTISLYRATVSFLLCPIMFLHVGHVN